MTFNVAQRHLHYQTPVLFFLAFVYNIWQNYLEIGLKYVNTYYQTFVVLKEKVCFFFRKNETKVTFKMIMQLGKKDKMLQM